MSMQLYGDKIILIKYPTTEVPLQEHRFIAEKSSGKRVSSFYAGEQSDNKRKEIDRFFNNFENGPVDIYNDGTMINIFKREFESFVFGYENLFMDNLSGYKNNIYKFTEKDDQIIGTAFYTESKKYLKVEFFDHLNLNELLYECISVLVIDKRDGRYYAYPLIKNDIKELLEIRKL